MLTDVKPRRYCAVMTQPEEWPKRLTKVIAGQVQRTRAERKMSAQQLADATAALGHAVPRSVIANLESGRRDVVSVAELLVLARALEVPPLLLVFPIGSASTVEVLPGVHAPTWPVARWFTGEGRFPTRTPDGGWEPADIDRWGDEATALFRNQQGLISDWRRFRGHASTVRKMLESGDPEKVEQFRDDVGRNDVAAIRAEEQLRTTRQIMRRVGLDPGPLPPELAHVDEADDGER